MFSPSTFQMLSNTVPKTTKLNQATLTIHVMQELSQNFLLRRVISYNQMTIMMTIMMTLPIGILPCLRTRVQFEAHVSSMRMYRKQVVACRGVTLLSRPCITEKKAALLRTYISNRIIALFNMSCRRLVQLRFD